MSLDNLTIGELSRMTDTTKEIIRKYVVEPLMAESLIEYFEEQFSRGYSYGYYHGDKDVRALFEARDRKQRELSI